MRVDVLTGPERRRFWSEDQKRALVAAAFAPGATVSEVARRADVNACQIYRWRKELRAEAVPGFAEVIVSSSSAGAPVASPASNAAIDVMVGGAWVRMTASVSPDLAAAVLTVLVGR